MSINIADGSARTDEKLLSCCHSLLGASASDRRYEESKWPRRPPSTGNLIRHLMDQHGLTRADMVPILGTPSRVSGVLGGKKGLSMAMVQRLHAHFHVPADLLLPPLKKAPASRSTKQTAA